MPANPNSPSRPYALMACGREWAISPAEHNINNKNNMKQRKQLKPSIPADFWQLRRDPKCYRKYPGRIKVQAWGLNARGELVTAGVHYVREISQKHAWKLAHWWVRWCKWYNRRPWNIGADYPTKVSYLMLAHYGLHPIDDPKAISWANYTPV